MTPFNRVFDPTRPDFTPYGFTCDLWQAGPMIRPDRHNEIEINFLPRSSCVYLIGGQQVRVAQGSPALFWAATPHQIIEISNHSPYFVATIPLAWFLSWDLPGGFVQSILSGSMVQDSTSGQARHDEHQFTQWSKDFSSRDTQVERAAALEIEARIRRLSATGAGGIKNSGVSLGAHDTLTLSKIEQMAIWVAHHYRESVTLKQLGTAVGLHPNYAAALYRKAFNTTIGSSIESHRIAHAQRLLVTTADKILAIALDSGFSSLSRFNTAFKRACGCPPRHYRRAHRSL